MVKKDTKKRCVSQQTVSSKEKRINKQIAIYKRCFVNNPDQ